MLEASDASPPRQQVVDGSMARLATPLRGQKRAQTMYFPILACVGMLLAFHHNLSMTFIFIILDDLGQGTFAGPDLDTQGFVR
jgi:hypothetical protein